MSNEENKPLLEICVASSNEIGNLFYATHDPTFARDRISAAPLMFLYCWEYIEVLRGEQVIAKYAMEQIHNSFMFTRLDGEVTKHRESDILLARDFQPGDRFLVTTIGGKKPSKFFARVYWMYLIECPDEVRPYSCWDGETT